MRHFGEFRLLPVVLCAAACLLTLKAIGIVRDGGYTLANSPAGGHVPVADARANEVKEAPAKAVKQSWAQEMFNYPDITGSVPETKPSNKLAGKKPAAIIIPDPASIPGEQESAADSRAASSAERAILGRLQERRQELEARARELDIREGLLNAAEKRLEIRLSELKDIEVRVKAAVAVKEGADGARFKSLVAMYENMKARDAAKVFDRLDLPTLIEVTSQINPRRMSDILGQMSPEVAERLTLELASRARSMERIPPAAELPKIEGKSRGS